MKRIALAFAAFAAVSAYGAAGDVREIGPGVSLIEGQFARGRRPDGNSLVLHGAGATIVIDTGRHVEHTQKVLAVATRNGLKPEAVINTHWHLDHVGGNVIVRRKYPQAKIIASGAIANARKGFLKEYREQLAQAVGAMPPDKSGGMRAEMALIDAGDKLMPDDVVTAPGERTIAGRKLYIGLERNAVTEGDVWVLDRASAILAAGDLVTLPVPFLDTADPDGWAAALERLSKVDAKLIVPGHGEPMKPSDLATYRKAFGALLACARSQRPSADCSKEWFAAIGDLARGSDLSLAQNAMGYYLDNVLRKPARANAK